MPPPHELLTTTRVANYFGLSAQTIRNWLDEDEAKPYDERRFPNAFKPSKHWRIPMQDVTDLINKLYGPKETTDASLA